MNTRFSVYIFILRPIDFGMFRCVGCPRRPDRRARA
jgi:hypothetical protein